jgi:EAL domain-containing protein (putative c-di-GMP-specific phosphodiesterase class I)
MASTSQPRLVLRFAVSTCIALALAAGAILMVVRHLVTVQAEHAATLQARVIANSALRGALTPADFEHPVGTARQAQLDTLLQARVLDDGVQLVEFFDHAGKVTYSTDHRLIGATPPVRPADLHEALAGTVRGDTTTLPSGLTADGRSQKALRTYAPVAVDGGTGVIALFQDYRPIASAAAATLLPTAGAALREPFFIDGFPLEVATSIGIAGYPDHGDHVDTLLRHADVAMYIAKEAHAGTVVYDPQEDTNDSARLTLAGELRRAIDGEELVLHFQPKAELRSGCIVGVEALVRWQHAERGFIPPGEFIPIAERTGLIKPLSRHVLATAIRQCSEWHAAGLDIHVAVNLTIPDLLDLALPDLIGGLLAETGVHAEWLELEITESTILSDPFRVRQVLSRFNEMGVRLAIDDFGTGYSSLAYLRRLPVQTIKIDRSFVTDMCENENDATIVRSTIELARNLGLEVVAEGVESQEAWDALRAQGCTLAQGYLFGRPLPAEEVTALLLEQAPHVGDLVGAVRPTPAVSS